MPPRLRVYLLCVGFVTNGTIQTGAVFVIYTVDFLILACFKPFSNSIIQCFTTMTVSDILMDGEDKDVI